jgi:hypothetical protein
MMDKKEQVIKNLKAVAIKLSQVINFKYLTLNWDVGDRSPVIKLCMDDPVFVRFHAFFGGYGSEWRGENICTIPVKCLTESFFNELSENDDYSEFIVSNEERTN